MPEKRGVVKKQGGVSAQKLPRERRHWQRLPLPIPIFARGVDDQGKEFLEFTTTLNVGAGGALLAMRRQLPPGANVLLEIPAAPSPRVALRQQFARSIHAHILRVTSAQSAYYWALRFDEELRLA